MAKKIYEANVLKYWDKKNGNSYSAVNVYENDKLIGSNVSYGDSEQNVYQTIERNVPKYKKLSAKKSNSGYYAIKDDERAKKVKVYQNVKETTRYKDLDNFKEN